MPRRLTFDRGRCLACRSCELACAVVHSTSGELVEAIAEDPLPQRRVTIAAGPRGVAALRCSQCDEPVCVFSCKSGALFRLADGGVEFDESRCVDCLMCLMVCPFVTSRDQGLRGGDAIFGCLSSVAFRCADRPMTRSPDHQMRNSPRHTISAGPVRKTSRSQRTVCEPPGDVTRSGDCDLPLAIAATAAAHDPVPEERVSPTPRSKILISISPLVRTRTSSTFVPNLKS